MSLFSPLFLGGVIVLTLAAFVLVVVLWPRLTRTSPLAVAGRVLALVVVNALVLLTAATQLNASYGFYSGWTDLRDSLSGSLPQTAEHRGGTATRAVDHVVPGPRATAATTVPPLTVPVSRSGVAAFTVHGPLSGLTGTVVVQLPPGYQSSEQRSRHYPVLEAFQGYPATPWNWVHSYQIGQILQQQEERHRIAPTLAVMPQVEFPAGVDTESVDGDADHAQVETWLTRDVPDWVAQTFRVRSDRDSWSTIGDSAGGWTAAMATLRHPSQYAAGIVLGGYFRPIFSRDYQPYPADSSRAAGYDLVRLAQDDPPPVALWVQTSHADHLSYPTSSEFLAATRAPTSVHAVVLTDAGHRASVWRALLPDAVGWLGSHVAGFSPS